MNVRAKFRVQSVTDYGNDNKQLKLSAVHDTTTEENRRFTKYTPSGELTMTVNNPAANAEFWPGREFYVDFTSVEEVEPIS